MDRKDMGANIANDEDIIRSILAAVTSAVSVPIWVKLTPSTSSLLMRPGLLTRQVQQLSRFAIPFLAAIDGPGTMKFEVEVDGLVTSGGLGGLAILHQALQRVSDISKAYLDMRVPALAASGGSVRPSISLCMVPAISGLHRGHGRKGQRRRRC